MCAQVMPSGECLRGKGPPDRMLAKPWRRLFLAAYTFRAKTRLLLLSCLTVCVSCHCCPVLYIVSKVERFVLTIIKQKVLILLSLLRQPDAEFRQF